MDSASILKGGQGGGVMGQYQMGKRGRKPLGYGGPGGDIDQVSESQSGLEGSQYDDANQFSGNIPYDKSGKRYRRTANEIERRFQCWCGKAYGSEGSLN